MRPFGPTTNGWESAFELRSASRTSVGSRIRPRQIRPPSVETSVPLGPTVMRLPVMP
jgi:hypothetical protein